MNRYGQFWPTCDQACQRVQAPGLPKLLAAQGLLESCHPSNAPFTVSKLPSDTQIIASTIG
jgi:hypothetical protein